MGTYIVRRILQMIPVILGATFLIFAMVFALPGDPVAGKCGERPCSAAYRAAFIEKYNLDDPLPVQYGKYVLNLAKGDLGTTASDAPVADQLKLRVPSRPSSRSWRSRSRRWSASSPARADRHPQGRVPRQPRPRLDLSSSSRSRSSSSATSPSSTSG